MESESRVLDDNYWKRREIQEKTGRCADCGKYILHEMYFDLYDAPRTKGKHSYAIIDWETERCLCSCDACDVIPNKLGECDCEWCSVCEDFVPNVVGEEEFTICKKCITEKKNASE